MVPRRKARRAGTTAALRFAQSGKPDAVAQMGRSNVCATQQWHAPDSDSTVHRSEGRLRGADLAGDARRSAYTRGEY